MKRRNANLVAEARDLCEYRLFSNIVLDAVPDRFFFSLDVHGRLELVELEIEYASPSVSVRRISARISLPDCTRSSFLVWLVDDCEPRSAEVHLCV